MNEPHQTVFLTPHFLTPRPPSSLFGASVLFADLALARGGGRSGASGMETSCSPAAPWTRANRQRCAELF